MGSQEAGYAEPMKQRLIDRIADAGRDPDDICWEPVYWARIHGRRQDSLWQRLSAGRQLRYRDIREFVIGAMGDALAYQAVPNRSGQMYSRIHENMLAHVRRMRRRMGDADKPLIIIAHSLGSVIMANYVWDRQAGYKPSLYGRTALERMETLSGVITFGSSLPLFSLAYHPIVSFTFPPPGLRRFFPPGTTAARLEKAARWLNFYDKDDVLGYPLKPISASYNKNVTEDKKANVGGHLTSWNPASHMRYWTDKDFTDPVARVIVDVLRLL